MQRIPDQFDPRAQATLSAAGGGSTSTTCSSCIVTLAAAAVVPAMLFTSLAASQAVESAPAAGVPPRRPMSRAQAVMWALAVPFGLLLVMLGIYLGMSFGGIGALAGLVALGAWVGVFAHVYDRTQGKGRKGVGVGVAMLIGLLILAAIEMYFWIN